MFKVTLAEMGEDGQKHLRFLAVFANEPEACEASLKDPRFAKCELLPIEDGDKMEFVAIDLANLDTENLDGPVVYWGRWLGD